MSSFRAVGVSTERSQHTCGEPRQGDHCGAWVYVAAWDVHRARLFGRCEARSGIAAFDRLLDQVMTQEIYRSARRVFG